MIEKKKNKQRTMDSQNEPTKPKRLKFSRLCLSQNQKAATVAPVRSSSQVSSSQISRFFTHSRDNDEMHRKSIGTVIQKTNTESINSPKISVAAINEATKTNSDNDDQSVSCNVDNKLNESQSHGKKRKPTDKNDNRTDSKSTIRTFFSNEHNDSLADFESPSKVTKKVPKVLSTKVVKSSRSRRKQQPDIRKALNKVDKANEDYSQLPEDAQLALALAISRAESINGIGTGVRAGSSTKPIDLDAFAFQPTNSKSSNSNGDALNFFNVDRKQRTRFKWNSKCTQLTRRNDELQKSKVRDKIDEILVNNIFVLSNQNDQLKSAEQIETQCDSIDYTPHHIHSRFLQRICISDRILFELNNCDKNTKSSLRSYYTNNLVEAAEHGAEALLKDWSEIPGRDLIYDGIQNTTNEIIETEKMAVISSSPEYDIQTESSLSGSDANRCDDQIDNDATTIIITDGNDEHQMGTAGCNSYAIQSSKMATQDVESDSEAQCLDDEDRTLIMDSNDIQTKIDAINSNMRLSQQFCDNFQASDFTCHATTTIRAPSPDLFDDDEDGYCAVDDAVESDRIQETSDRKSSVVVAIDDGTTCSGTTVTEVATDDVIMISSSEGNTNECNTDPVFSGNFESESQHSSTPIAAIETIELLDSDSEGMLDECIESPKIQRSQDNRKSQERAPPNVLPDMKLLDDEFRNLMQSIGCATQEQPNHSTKSNETPTVVKKLSFTERLELFEKDMLNGFTADLPDDILHQPQQQHQLSQESHDLSDDEINYSMRKGAMPDIDDDHYDGFDFNDCDNELHSPIELDLSDSNSNLNQMDSEQNLINQSVCNIFEKTFEQFGSPVEVNKKSSKAKTLKKFQSETVLSTRYGPSTSGNNRNQTTPTKSKRQFESSKNAKERSPISQPSVETRMDISNDEYYVRIGSISPKPNYEQMDAMTLELELRKYGLKPSLSRRQAIICLEYIYNRTHPFMEAGADLSEPLKNNKYSSTSINQLNAIDKAIRPDVNGADDDNSNDPQINFNVGFAAQNLVDERFKCSKVDKVFLPSMPRAKKPWCLEPLHIAWHNLIKANSDLRQAILLYEPINLVELKKFFRTIDMTFDNRDLIAFLDLHCITFRMIKPSKV